MKVLDYELKDPTEFFVEFVKKFTIKEGCGDLSCGSCPFSLNRVGCFVSIIRCKNNMENEESREYIYKIYLEKAKQFLKNKKLNRKQEELDV